LLDALSRRFAAGGLRLKGLVREIVLSEAYQRSSRVPGPGIAPESYRVALPRALTAEQLARSLMAAADVRPSSGGGKFNLKDYLNGKGAPPTSESDLLELFAAVFGNAPGEPETEFSPSTTHALFLMNDRLVLAWLKPLAERGPSVEEIYLRVLSRRPSDVERREADAFLAKHPKGAADLAWALVASAEFRLNH
ncbi:MAG TPA: DUF1553 domain-containing protein, partial [Planctomycetota bacterium]|nr:DUF1553 domain-containing protein [Planctomycetota bacterium]